MTCLSEFRCQIKISFVFSFIFFFVFVCLSSGIKLINESFKTMLLIQLLGSLFAVIFGFYILQTDLYAAVMLSCISLIIQIFLYGFMGDMLLQKVPSIIFTDATAKRKTRSNALCIIAKF